MRSSLVWRVERDPARYRALLRWSHSYGPIKGAQQVADIMGPIADREDSENAWMMLLDTHGFMRGIDPFARGGRESVTIPIQDALRATVIAGSRYAILIHNHPSGSALPSDADVELTADVARGCQWVGALLLDHVIMGAGQFYSFREGSRWRTTLLTP
jgi:DNA repair protein RadC